MRLVRLLIEMWLVFSILWYRKFWSHLSPRIGNLDAMYHEWTLKIVILIWLETEKWTVDTCRGELSRMVIWSAHTPSNDSISPLNPVFMLDCGADYFQEIKSCCKLFCILEGPNALTFTIDLSCDPHLAEITMMAIWTLDSHSCTMIQYWSRLCPWTANLCALSGFSRL